jgi:ketosteroid isomerase-like protein
MTETLSALADTETGTDPKIDTVRRVYAAFNRGDVDAILAEVADDVDWANEAASRSVPWFGSHRGKAGVARFCQELGSSVRIAEFTPLSFTSNRTDVMVTIRWTFTALSTGRTATETLHHWWRLADGKIAFYRGSEDSELSASLFSDAGGQAADSR